MRGARLLHPTDTATGIRYRLLPMTRAVLAELFTPDEARRHLDIVARELRFPDGVRLMSEPATYHGGRERLFKRADTAANVGREIGLQYVHAHLRYAQAMAKVGDADALWWALQVCNPVGLSAIVSNATAAAVQRVLLELGCGFRRSSRGGGALERAARRCRGRTRRLAALFQRPRPVPAHGARLFAGSARDVR